MNQTIKCNVDGCKYNEEAECTLSAITVGNDLTSVSGEAQRKEETECNSFAPHQ